MSNCDPCPKNCDLWNINVVLKLYSRFRTESFKIEEKLELVNQVYGRVDLRLNYGH